MKTNKNALFNFNMMLNSNENNNKIQYMNV